MSRVTVTCIPDEQALGTPATLLVQLGPDGRRIDLRALDGALVIGGGSDADVVVADECLSRRQFALSMGGRWCRVHPLPSKNPTSVNGVELAPRVNDTSVLLSDGSIVRAGRTAWV